MEGDSSNGSHIPEVESCIPQATISNPEVASVIPEGASSGQNIVNYVPEVEDISKPKLGQEFGSLDEAYDFYNAYAKEAGFCTRLESSKKRKGSNEIWWKQFVCNKQGHSIVKGTIRNRSICRMGCKARISFSKRVSSTKWAVCAFIEKHNHELTSPRKVHLLKSHRKVTAAKRNLAKQLSEANVPTHQQLRIMEIQSSGIENVAFTERDLRNVERDLREEKKGIDAETLFEYFSSEQYRDPGFYFQFEKNDDDRLIRCFWADSISRRAYTYFGDVVAFDTTYQTNKYGMIFAHFVGVNHHSQSIIFGCGFLSDETTESFIWLFDQWLMAMACDPPQIIITDQDPTMTSAIAQRMPQTFHRYCIWHIMNKFPEKLGPANHHAYYKHFQTSVYGSETPKEFESSWNAALDVSNLGNNKWLNTMFNLRHKWVPAYINHIFSAGMSSSQRAESAHNFLKKFVFRKNTLMDFIIRFNRCLMQQRHNELQADHGDINEKTPVRARMMMEEQMVDVYTKKIFLSFQEELLESNRYIVTAIGGVGDGSHCEYTVEHGLGANFCRVHQIVFNESSDFARCSCRFFEFEGIPCRHIIAFLRFKQKLLLPNQYILPRWTTCLKAGRKLRFGCSIVGGGSSNSTMMRHAKLFGAYVELVDRASISDEGVAIALEAFEAATQKINALSQLSSNTPHDTSSTVNLENRHINLL